MPSRTFIAGLLLALAMVEAGAQPARRPRPPAREVPFKLVGAELVKLAQPLDTTGRKAAPLREALLVKVEIDARTFDALPPSIEPFLYVGRLELRPFTQEHSPERGLVTLTYYSPDMVAAAGLPDGAPMVITLDHGAPARDAKRFSERTDVPRFRRELLKDRR